MPRRFGGEPRRGPNFARITTPLQVHHGRQDDTCPLDWSRATVRALRQAGKDVDFRIYDGEGHTFYDQWDTSIRRSTAFFDRHLT